MNEHDIQKLVQTAHKMKEGDRREATLNGYIVSDGKTKKLVTQVYVKPSPEKLFEDTVRNVGRDNIIPFTAGYSNSEKTQIKGEMNVHSIKKTVKKGRLSLVRGIVSKVDDFLSSKIREAVDYAKDQADTKEYFAWAETFGALERTYTDDLGRDYYVDRKGNHIYMDDFGNLYTILKDSSGRKIEIMETIDNEKAIFLNSEHTLIKKMDGLVYEYSPEKALYVLRANEVSYRFKR